MVIFHPFRRVIARFAQFSPFSGVAQGDKSHQSLLTFPYFEVYMSAQLRPYKAFFPQIGLRVMIDASSVVIGDVTYGSHGERYRPEYCCVDLSIHS